MVKFLVTKFYPELSLGHNKNPNRLWAFPILGILFKLIILIPVFIFAWLLALAVIFILFINSFYVLINGKYWDSAYSLILTAMKYNTKLFLFIAGMSDKYPGFNFDTEKHMLNIEIPKPTSPNRWFAFPILGGVFRIILLIPFSIYSSILQNGAYVGVIISSFVVLFKGKYPESVFEFVRDSMRIGLSTFAYFGGLSDNYPSFKIDLKNHRNIKIALIIVGVLITLSSNFKKDDNFWQPKDSNPPQYQYSYSNSK